MPDIPPIEPTPPPESAQQKQHDDFVGQVVEKAAEKVASVSTMNGHKTGEKPLSRIEGYAFVVTLLMINLAILAVLIGERSNSEQHRSDFRTVCQIIVERAASPENARDLATRLAECLDDD